MATQLFEFVFELDQAIPAALSLFGHFEPDAGAFV
jgi:hypothetical protein